MNDRVVDDVRTIRHLVEDSGRLINEVDLESNDEIDLARVVPGDRNTGDEVDERFTSLLIVDERSLTFLKTIEVRSKVIRSVRIGVTTLLSLSNLLISGSLEETTYRRGARNRVSKRGRSDKSE